jgi:uncharacterized protein
MAVPEIKPGRATISDMRATIELPEPVFHLLQARAEQRSSSIQAVILEAIQKEIALGSTSAEGRGRVSLPLIRSSHPGSLHSLTNTRIDDILGWHGVYPRRNVWIAAASDRHEHHAVARQWFDSDSAPVCFCRLTQMAFLRLLTNPKVMGEDILSPATAIAVYRQLFSDERVRFEAEPANIENAWVSLMSIGTANGGTWTDAYLAAFAMEAGFRLISFDRGMRRWPGLPLELLIPG